MLDQRLQQKQLQKLSPQQIQLMKLLQIPSSTLEQRIKEELESNPALEEGNEDDGDTDFENESVEGEEEFEFEIDDYLDEYYGDDPSVYNGNKSKSDEEYTLPPMVVQDSFHDHLESQLGMLDFENEEEYQIALQIIGSIDDDGYLRREPVAIVDDLMFTQNLFIEENEVRKVLKKVQRLDPPGIGAKDLEESLVLQMERKLEQESSPTQYQRIAYQVLKDYFEQFSKKHYNKIVRALNIEEDDLRLALDEILKLNPKPASAYGRGKNTLGKFIIPDFIIQNKDGELDLTLNSRNAPDLRVSNQYQDMLESYVVSKKSGKVNSQQKEAALFIKQKIDSAKWFIDAIIKRQETMYKAMYALLQFQYEYFKTGDPTTLKPMILKDIADITGLDISTVSRVANSKYVQTEYGTKLLKEFFSESVQNEDGEEVSTLEVKNILSQVVERENKRKPLSDEKLRAILHEKGYPIARRTIAKYREQLNIPVARLRKQL